MIRSLLVRGMLTGMVAGLLVFCWAHWLGEPEIDRAIAIESSMDQAQGGEAEPVLVSRHTQKNVGLLTGVVLYGAALGGIFGLVFAYAQGRWNVAGPRQLAATVAALGYVAIVVVPGLKYPANPPAVGNPETIGMRTAAYFLLIAFSLASLGVCIQFYRRFAVRYGCWNGALLSAALFGSLVALISHFLPTIDEVPPDFPASLLWRFRLVSAELQVILWASVGLMFGWLSERVPAQRSATSS